MAALFLDWFHKCFIPEVKRYLKEKGLDFKVLLIIDNAPGHAAALWFPHNDIEVVFLPPQYHLPILQPLDQGMIRYFKATYMRLTFSQIRSARDAHERRVQYLDNIFKIVPQDLMERKRSDCIHRSARYFSFKNPKDNSKGLNML
ncbi:unnamed protein product [Natator depressus]